MMITSGLLSLTRELSISEVGGKASVLGQLCKQGYPVPKGVVVLTKVLQEHLGEWGADKPRDSLSEAIAGCREGQAIPLSQELRQTVLRKNLHPKFSHALQSSLLSTGISFPLVVRSSAVGEDSKEHSFAGQLDSFLHVDSQEALERAIVQCWASLFTERSIHYQLQRRRPLHDLGVLIQQQVRAKLSGVLFTRSPGRVGHRGEILCEYVMGLCDALVSGESTPGSLEVCRSTRRILQHRAISPEFSIIPYEQAFAELFAIALRLESELGYPLDIEWSIDEQGVVWILQARAITASAVQSDPSSEIETERGEEQIQLWSNANISENYFEPLTPLLYSFASKGYSQYFRNLGLGFGLSQSRVAAMDPHLERVVGLHCGRFYYNLSSIHSLIRLAPFGSRLCRFFDEFVGAEGAKGAHDKKPPRDLLSGIREFFLVPTNVLVKYLGIQGRVRRFEQRIESFCASLGPEVVQKKSLAELESDFRTFLNIRFHQWNDAALADTATMICCGLLRRALPRKADKSDDRALYTTLLTGVSDLKSSLPVIELWKLSRKVRADAALSELFSGSSPEQIRQELERRELSTFRKEFFEYLREWGFRSSGELLLTKVSPLEDPLGTLGVLKQYALQEGPGPDELIAIQHRAGQEAVSALSPHLRFLVFMTHGAIRLRERARFQQARLYVHLRMVLMAMGKLLADKGALSDQEDILFLGREELFGLLSGSLQFPEELRGDIERRRLSYQAFWNSTPPSQLLLPLGRLYRPDEALEARSADSEPRRTLHGLGACGGRVSGRARILQSASEGGDLKPGEILVTSQTDPGWASVFPLITGLVVERGGILSHGAIVAREYGIPAVVGAPEVCKRIQTGMRIHVDGDRGTVEIDE